MSEEPSDTIIHFFFFSSSTGELCSQPIRNPKCRLKSSIYFHHPLQDNSANYYLILGLRDKAEPPTSQQINKFLPKRMKNIATPSSIFIVIFSSSTGELCSQPIRGSDRRIGRMFPEHVERNFLDPNIASTNTSN